MGEHMTETSLKETSVILLAGGRSSRMGKNKAMLDLNGQPFIEKILAQVAGAGEVILVTNTPEVYQEYAFRIVEDNEAYGGPLQALYKGLEACVYDKALVLTVDVPLITRPTLEDMVAKLEGHEDIHGLVPLIKGRSHPLMAVYRKTALSLFKRAVEEKERRMMTLLSQLTIVYMNEKDFGQGASVEREFRNVNTPEDYQGLIKEENH